MEPENRLVARALERHWDECLRAVSELDAQHSREAASGRLTLSNDERAAIQALSEQLPQVWADSRTSTEDRKRLLRCLIEAVEFGTDRTSDRITCNIVWKSGARSQLVVSRPVRVYSELGRYPELTTRIRELSGEGRTDKQIALTLEAEGLRPARVRSFHPGTIWLLRHSNGIAAGSTGAPPKPAKNTRRFTVHALADELGVFVGTVYTWLATGRLHSLQHTRAAPHWIDLTPSALRTLRAHVDRERRRGHAPSNNPT